MEHDRDAFNPVRDQVRGPDRRAVAVRLNRIADGLNALHGELSDLRHELHIESRLADMQTELSHRQSVIVGEEREAGALRPGNGGEDA